LATYDIYLLDAELRIRDVETVNAIEDSHAIDHARTLIVEGGLVGRWGDPASDVRLCSFVAVPGPFVSAVVRRRSGSVEAG
jgi:hypothetical protein